MASEEYLYALGKDGKVKWKYATDDAGTVSPIIGPEGIVYVGTAKCSISAIRPDGSVEWTYSGENNALQDPRARYWSCSMHATPVASASGSLYVPGFYRGMYVLSLETGDFVCGLESVVIGNLSSPAILPNGVMLQGSQTEFQWINTEGQAYKTETEMGGEWGSLAVSADKMVVVSGPRSLNAYDDHENMKWTIPGTWMYAPVITNTGVVYIADSTNFNAISADGTVKWKVPMLWTGPAAVAENGVIYVGAASRGRPADSLYSFDPSGGLRWEFPVDGSANNSRLGPPGPAIGPDGTVYVVTQGMQGNHEGVVYAIGEKNGGLMKGGWPKFRGTMSNDGHASFQ